MFVNGQSGNNGSVSRFTSAQLVRKLVQTHDPIYPYIYVSISSYMLVIYKLSQFLISYWLFFTIIKVLCFLKDVRKSQKIDTNDWSG